MLIGYVRVSKSDGTPTLEPQRDAMLAAGVDPARIYEDLASGRRDDRPGLAACLKAIQPGNTLVLKAGCASTLRITATASSGSKVSACKTGALLRCEAERIGWSEQHADDRCRGFLHATVDRRGPATGLVPDDKQPGRLRDGDGGVGAAAIHRQHLRLSSMTFIGRENQPQRERSSSGPNTSPPSRAWAPARRAKWTGTGGVAEFVRYLATHGEYGAVDVETEVRRLSERVGTQWSAERTRPDGRVIEVRSNPVPGGGVVLIYSDITERKRGPPSPPTTTAA
jgi:hypothetical protein